jgi:hypothetical protein
MTSSYNTKFDKSGINQIIQHLTVDCINAYGSTSKTKKL